jgi:RNA polymerase sigma-70 factor (ECF subfamily)
VNGKPETGNCIFCGLMALGVTNHEDLNRYHQSKEQIFNESQIIEEARKDPGRFGILYEKYHRQIFVFVFRRTGDEDIAGDLVSDAFLKAMVALPKYESKGLPFSAWLFRIALNEVNMYYRKTSRERVISLDGTNLADVIAEAGGEKESEENRQLVMKLLSTLTTEEMQMMELRFFEKRAFAEVGEILGITENNAKVKTYRIIDKLKIALKKTDA